MGASQEESSLHLSLIKREQVPVCTSFLWKLLRSHQSTLWTVLQGENEEFRKQFGQLREVFSHFNRWIFFWRTEKFQKYTRCREQKADVANLRKDFISLKEYNRVQVRTRLYECNCTIVLHDDDASIRWGALNMFWRQCWWKYQRWEEKFQEFNSGGKII